MTSVEFRALLWRRATAAGVQVDDTLIARLEAYFGVLAHWNTRINLTGFSLDTPTLQAVDRLLVEPLRIAKLLSQPVHVWFDLGSGGGSPALPLQLYKPAKRLVLVESKERKAAFLREAVRELSLDGVEVEVARIESITSNHRFAGTVDLVTVRAVRRSLTVFDASRALLREGGRAVLVGSRPDETIRPEAFQIIPTVEFAADEAIVVFGKI
jgi:16S rRNA (guanine527-N7)-methyltransferase